MSYNKTVAVHTVSYLYGYPIKGDQITLNGKWKTIIKNDKCHLEFQDMNGIWWPDWGINIYITEEYLNEC